MQNAPIQYSLALAPTAWGLGLNGSYFGPSRAGPSQAAKPTPSSQAEHFDTAIRSARRQRIIIVSDVDVLIHCSIRTMVLFRYSGPPVTASEFTNI